MHLGKKGTYKVKNKYKITNIETSTRWCRLLLRRGWTGTVSIRQDTGGGWVGGIMFSWCEDEHRGVRTDKRAEISSVVRLNLSK